MEGELSTTNTELAAQLLAQGRQIATLQERIDNHVRSAAEDRQYTRAKIDRVVTKVDDIEDKITGAIHRLEGGRMVIKALWIAGGITAGAATWAFGWAKPLVQMLAR